MVFFRFEEILLSSSGKMNIKPVKTKRDYQAALARLETIFDAKPGTIKGDELERVEHSLTSMSKSTIV